MDFVINRVRTRECKDLLLPKKHALSEVRWDQILRWQRALFGVRCSDSCQPQSFLCRKFSTARLEILPNLRQVGVFQMSTMVNLGIGFQEPLTRPGVKLDEKMSNYSSDSERSRGIYKFQLAGKWSESKKMSCHAILKNLYGPKMDVIFLPFFFYLLSFFFPRFWLVLFAYLFCCFSINMYLNNYYLIKCNKQKEKYCVSRAKIVY